MVEGQVSKLAVHFGLVILFSRGHTVVSIDVWYRWFAGRVCQKNEVICSDIKVHFYNLPCSVVAVEAVQSSGEPGRRFFMAVQGVDGGLYRLRRTCPGEGRIP